MCLSTLTPVISNCPPANSCPAKSLSDNQRQGLAVQAIAGVPVTELAEQAQVSRKFVYQQASTARQALDEAFTSSDKASDQVLFYLPVTKDWLRQLILGLLLHCHSSYRGVLALLQDCFDFSLSIGTVHNIVAAAVGQARRVNTSYDLSTVRIGAHDEIFQNGKPVLVGVDVTSTFCYLLSLEEHRDADTWGLRLLELQDRGLNPDATVADAGTGLRAGQDLAWPGKPCRGDVFHALRDLGQLATFLDNRAYGAIDACDRLERRMERAKRKGQGNAHSKRLALARQERARAIALADDVATLVGWMQHDVLAVAGPDHPSRCQLFDFVVAELETRQTLCPHRIEPLVKSLRNQRDNLLAFAAVLDRQLADLAREFHIAPTLVRELLQVDALDPCSPARWQRDAQLHRQLGDRYWALHQAVAEVAAQTVRASSVVENLNSRLRSYFFLRRSLGPDYLELLQFFLNHRLLTRSEHPERVGKSPAELITRQDRPHWLELLGYQRFERN